MIYDALYILWDCNQQFDKSLIDVYAHDGDAEIFSKICEIARNHHRIQNFIEVASFHSRKLHTEPWTYGLYAQALSEGMTEVTRTYKKVLMDTEKLVIGNPAYTLSFIYSNVEKYQSLFVMLNKIISTIKDRRLIGCQILSLIHQHILSGSRFARDAILKIFCTVNEVFVNQLCSWLLYGELRDPFKEFFICKQNNETIQTDTFLSISNSNVCDRALVTSLQESQMEYGYNINPSMIPYYMHLSLAQDTLFIGKTIILFSFDPRLNKKSTPSTNKPLLPLQLCISAETRRFTIWEDREAEFHEKLQKLKTIDSYEVCNLRSVIRDVKDCVTKHLWVVAVEEAQLVHELRLLKDFYLLGRGELFLELLRRASHILEAPTTRTATRDMNQAFQCAARAVFLSNNADVENFSFELPYVKSNSSMEENVNKVGWSNIILKYNFKWPLHLLFTPEVLAGYNNMFRLLLQIKKTQHDLHALWKTYKQSTSFSVCQLHNKLMFLMDNLQHYLQADVLETNFSKLMEAVNKTNDFKHLKKVHAAFLEDILSQSFLTDLKDSDDDSREENKKSVFVNIMSLLKLCNEFCHMSETVMDKDVEKCYLQNCSLSYNDIVRDLMELLSALRGLPRGVYLARLLMRLDYNRWLSGEAQLTRSVTNML